MQRFIINFIFAMVAFGANAQLFHPLEQGRSPFVRISIDPTVPIKTFLQKANMTGFELTVDSEIKQNLFAVGGFGMGSCNISQSTYSYSNAGAFAKVGADLNLTQYKNPQDRDIFFLGLRYGFAALSQEAQDIVLENEWGVYNTSVPRESYTASWLELAMGVKAEMAKNIFIGWTGSAKFRTHLSDGEMRPYNVPGFGKNDNSFTFDFNFFISYAITMKPPKAPLNNIE